MSEERGKRPTKVRRVTVAIEKRQVVEAEEAEMEAQEMELQESKLTLLETLALSKRRVVEASGELVDTVKRKVERKKSSRRAV